MKPVRSAVSEGRAVSGSTDEQLTATLLVQRAGDPEREEAMAVRQGYVELYVKSHETLDKVMLAVSSGALGLSMSFIEKLAPLEAARWKWLLASGWAALALAIATGLLSYMGAARANLDQISEIDEQLKNGSAVQGSRWRSHTRRLNIATLGATILGVLLIVAFAVANLWR